MSIENATPKLRAATKMGLSPHCGFPVVDEKGWAVGLAYARQPITSSVPESYSEIGQPEAAAMARLFAAAPEMLDALKAIRDLCDRLNPGQDQGWRLDAVRSVATNAIRAAEGGES